MWLKKGGYIILDFGRELHGGISMASMGVVNGVGNLRIVFGESVMEAKSTIGEKNALNAHSMRDFVAQISSYSSAQPYGNTGFRFVKVEALDTDFDILTIKAYLVMRDLPRLGTFSSNDERLNHIWDTAVYTVQLNMQDYIWDGIKRDRDVWIGDMHPEVSTIRTVFGNVDVVKKSLDFVRDDTPQGEWMNNILTYSMWWIIIHYDLYMHYGDFGRYCYVGFRHSLCHGWASGPAAFLTETIAGIEILEPGCKKIKIIWRNKCKMQK